jgi:hypothetical protein
MATTDDYRVPLWFEEIVPPDDREAVLERIQGMNNDGLREWFTTHYWNELYRYLRNWFEIDHEEPFDVDVNDIPAALRGSSECTDALMIVLDASQKENIRFDWSDISVPEHIVDQLYVQLGWLRMHDAEGYELIKIPHNLTEFRWSTNDPDFVKGWQIRPKKKLYELPNGVWITRTIFEKYYQKRLEKF